MGAITDVVQRYVPASYRSLIGATNSYDYGITQLQALADFVQYRLFATIPGSSNEATVWNPNEEEFLGIVTTIRFIPTAVEYWGQALQSQTTSGTEEDVTYFDRRPDLWKIYDKLIEQANELAPIVGVNLNTTRAIIPQVSYGDNGRGVLVTEDPSLWPPAYRPSDTLGTELILVGING